MGSITNINATIIPEKNFETPRMKSIPKSILTVGRVCAELYACNSVG
jgi:hypothetical protein